VNKWQKLCGMRKLPRYRVEAPVDGGFSWYRVIDTQNAASPNTSVAMISDTLDFAKEVSERIAEVLNARANGAG